MNIKQLYPPLAAGMLLLLASCTSETELVDPVPPDNGEGNETARQEVLLTLKNKFSLATPATKADAPIATPEENYLQTLDVYVFGSTTEDGDYTFQELYYYRDDPSTVAGDWAHPLSLSGTPGDQTTTSLLKLTKGLYVKLYCIANRPHLYQTDAGGTMTAFAGFQPLAQSAPGQPGNTVIPGIPTEENFLKMHVKPIDPLAAAPTTDDVLTTPIPMTGAYTTPLDLTDFSVSARTQLGFKLNRMLARFDLVNDAAVSKLTVQSISLVNGQRGSWFFPAKTMDTDKTKLITYPARTISADTQQAEDPDGTGTTSLTPGAFYMWPSPKNDAAYLVLHGTYAVNQTQQQPVSYKVPFLQVRNGAGSYIEVTGNHRYTIAITNADAYHLDFTLNVAEWSNDGNLDDYLPDNDFDNATTIQLDAAKTTGANVLADGSITVLPQAGSKFAFDMGSNTALQEELIYKDGSEKWLITDPAARTKAVSMTTTFAYKVDETALAGNRHPVTIRLVNPASGKRKEIIVAATGIPTP